MDVISLRELDLAGVKWELSENPHATDKSEAQKKTSIPADVTTKATPAVGPAIIPASAPVAREMAQDLAQAATDLDMLTQTIADFDHPLKQFVQNVVMPHFISNADLLILTDMPSSDDDQNGRILTNGSGQLMDKMLAAIGLTRETVSIVPLIFWRTPGGRGPAREELDLARPFVDRAIELLSPRAILTLGTLTAAEILGAKLPKDHGKIFHNDQGTPIIPIYHPNYLMLKPDAKRDVWAALQDLQKTLKSTAESL